VLMACSVMTGDWGWRKERYPLAAIIARSKIAIFPVTLSRAQACAAYPGEIRFLSVLFRTPGSFKKKPPATHYMQQSCMPF